MPTKSDTGKGWTCDTCQTQHHYKRDATFCEKRHEAQKAWAAGEITDQQYADFLEIDIESVREMTRGGTSLRSTAKQPGIQDEQFYGTKGVFVNITQVHSQGRTQIPHQIRAAMGIKDGDNLFWYKGPDGRYYIDNQQITQTPMTGKQIRVAR